MQDHRGMEQMASTLISRTLGSEMLKSLSEGTPYCSINSDYAPNQEELENGMVAKASFAQLNSWNQCKYPFFRR